MIEENVKKLLSEAPEYNPQGERVRIVAAVKMQTAEDINRAIAAGITDIGDNHVQEFKEKYDLIVGNPARHFIGHLQTNKVKYLIGKVALYHSVDRLQLAEELSKRSLNAGISSEILLQINIGNEQTKGGFAPDGALQALKDVSALGGLKIRGFMAMLPFSDDQNLLRTLALRMRALFDEAKKNSEDFDTLSMGMSGDWKLCVECGSNMVRIGTAIFGARNYAK